MTSAKDKKLMSSLQGELAQAIVSDHKEWEVCIPIYLFINVFMVLILAQESLTTTFSSMAFHALSEEYAAKMAEHSESPTLHTPYKTYGMLRYL